MKKLFALVALMATMTVASAQLVQFGITGDVAFDKYKTGKFIPADTKADLGWSAGVKLKVSSMMGIGADISVKYAQEDRDYFFHGASNGLGYDDTPDGYEVNAAGMRDRFSFISVPVNLRYDFKMPAISHAVIPFIFAGPEFHYNINQYDIDEITTSIPNGFPVNGPIRDYIKQNRINWDLNFGLGVIFGNHFELAYQYRMRKSDSFKSDYFERLIKSKTNKVALTVYF